MPGDFTHATVTEEMIRIAEKTLGVKLPDQYIAFLQQFGHGGIGGIEVLGVGLTGRMIFVDTTMEHRDEELPVNLVVIENVDEWLVCIDCCTEKIVSWDFSGYIKEEYSCFDDYLIAHIIVDEGTEKYAVTLPNALKYVYTAMFAFGLFLAVLFSAFYYNGSAGVTVGHIIFAVVFATIGLVVMFICARWRIDVDGDRFTIHYAFKPPETYTFQDVEKVRIGSKGEMAVFVDGKKVRTIDALAANSDIIERKFESYDKVEWE